MIDALVIRQFAQEFGWTEIETQGEPMLSFRKDLHGSPARINVWLTGTVGTYLNHPRKGKTQLFRRYVGRRLLRKIFENPRVHTDRGYQTRRSLRRR